MYVPRRYNLHKNLYIPQHATLENFPRLREILTQLFFSPPQDVSETSCSDVQTLTHPSLPAERYYSLSPEDRLSILSFFCNLAVSSKTVRSHMETCEEALTEYRKTKIDVNRLKKQQCVFVLTVIFSSP